MFQTIRSVESFEAQWPLAVVLLASAVQPGIGGLAIQKDEGDVWLCTGADDPKTSAEVVADLPENFVGYILYEGISPDSVDAAKVSWTLIGV